MESGRLAPGVHGSTFGGNPLACAAALTALDILERETLPERAATLGTRALDRLSKLSTHSSIMREVRGRGLLIGIELSRRVQPYLEALLDRGILALPAGPNVIRLLPPLVITEEQLERALDVVEEVLVGQPGGDQPRPYISSHNTTGGQPGGDQPRPYISSHNTTGGQPDGDQPRPYISSHSTGLEVSLLHTMLTIPSYSRQEGTLARYLVQQGERMGLITSIDEVGNFVARTSTCWINPHSTGNTSDSDVQEPVILLGHMDTVPGAIPVRLQDGLLYGRGAVDAKGPLAAFLSAAARLARSGELQRPILVIGAVEEEAATSRGARAVLERYQPSACIIGEPSGSQAVTIGYKGRLLVEYCIARPLGHSAGPQQNSSEVAVTFWERVRNHALEWNQQHAGDSSFAALAPALRSINNDPGGLEERTHLVIGYRLPPGYEIEALRAQLQCWAQEDEATINFSGEEVAFQTTRATPLARAFISAIRTTGRQPAFKHKTGTSDMNVVGPVWGQNIIAYGPGDSRLDHTPHEHICITEYLQAIDVLEVVLREIALRKETVL